MPLGLADDTVTTYTSAARVTASQGADVQADYDLLKNLYSRWFGGDARDAARDNRAAWLTSLALHGNVRAAQAILGGQGEMSGGEHDRYVKAEDYIRTQGQGDVMEAAAVAGPYWSYEDASNYPRLRAFVQGWTGVTAPLQAGVTAAVQAGGGVPAVAVLVGVGAVLFLLSRKR
jgi:hypothetical protein